MKLKYLFLPGSVSLFFLLQFLQATAIFEDGVKWSYLSLLRWGVSEGVSSNEPAAIIFRDAQNQLALLLTTTLLLLGPPLVWALVVSYKSWRSKGKASARHDDESSGETL